MATCKATKQIETKPALGHSTWDEGDIKEATCLEQELRLIPVVAAVEQRLKKSQKQNMTMVYM